MNRTKEDIIKALQTVIDPDIGLDVWTLGFIYEINIKENEVIIVMTLTTPLCPLQSYLREEVENVVRSLGFSSVFVQITFDPPWTLPKELGGMMKSSI